MFPASPFLEIYPHHPDLCPRVQDQNECFKPEKFDELALAKLIAIHYVYLQKLEKHWRKLLKARLKGQPCFVKYGCQNDLISYITYISCADKKDKYLCFEPYQFNSETKQSKLVSSSFLLLSMGQLFPFP